VRDPLSTGRGRATGLLTVSGGLAPPELLQQLLPVAWAPRGSSPTEQPRASVPSLPAHRPRAWSACSAVRRWECRTCGSIAPARRLTACCRRWRASRRRCGRRCRPGHGQGDGPTARGFHPERVAIGPHRDGTVVVGAKDPGSQRLIAGEDGGGWMAKAVVRLHREHDGAGAHSADKGVAAGGPTAMMGRCP
jgi:hypothetical protein